MSQKFMKLYDSAQFREAEPVARRVLDIAPRLYPGKPLPHGKALQNLAEVLLRLGKLQEAEQVAALGVQKFQQVGEPGKLAYADGLDLQGRIATAQGKYQDAETWLKRGLEIRQDVWGPLHDHVGKSQLNLGALYISTGRFSEAEQSLKSAISVFERMLGPTHFSVGDAATNLGNLLQDQGRFREAESLHLRALKIREAAYGDESFPVAQALQNLSNAFKSQGRFAEAESTARRALAINRAILPAGHPSLGDLWNNLGNIADDQGRSAEAAALYRDALANYQQAYGVSHARVAMALNNLALALESLQKYDEAATLLQQAYEMRTKLLGAEHPETLSTLANIGSNQWYRGQLAQARQTDELLLTLRRKVLGDAHPDVVSSLRNLAVTLRSQREFAAAESLLNEALELAAQMALQPGDVAQLYDLRARTRHELQRPREALEDLQNAIEQLELQRREASGGEIERAQAFAVQSDIYERMIAWSIAQQDLEAAWAAAERSRARTLLDQLELRGGDLLAGVHWRTARPLRKRETEARTRLSQLEMRLQKILSATNVKPADRQKQAQALSGELLAARRDVIAAYRDIRNASPAYRLMLTQEFNPAGPAAVESWLQPLQGMLLRYYIGTNASWVFVLRPGQPPVVEPLTVSSKASAESQGAPQPLTDAVLRSRLLDGDQPGLLSLLNVPEPPQQVIGELEALWQILLPERVREQLLQQEFKHLVVVPDGPLASLPFETLVVQSGTSPQYLLDVGPPVFYAPSATLLLNLATREPGTENRGILSVGDAIYASERGANSRSNAGPQFYELLGPLPRLPFTAAEAQGIAKAFFNVKLPATLLQRETATEASVRKEVAKKQFVHLACHGFCDESYNNFFGALILTGGPIAEGADNDGFLTVVELAELPLQGCELAILSACETNHGPQQKGEGVWALSRGVLAGGARRVIASEWLVDDEAAAALISQVGQRLAEAAAEKRSLELASQLHALKRWVRAQEKWKHPYFWGSFVLIGPP